MMVKARSAIANVTLHNLRDAAGWSQQEVADALNALALEHGHGWSCTAQTVSRWERGVVERPEPVARRLLAEFFEVPIAELGFTRPLPQRARTSTVDGLDLVIDSDAPTTDPVVERHQEEWRAARAGLNTHRHVLTNIAARLYEPRHRLGTTGLLTAPGWVAPEPLDLTEIRLQLVPDAEPPALSGSEPQASGALPLKSLDQRYGRYSHALRDLAPPRLLENRLSYRLLGFDWQTNQMTFGYTSYFDMIDVCELLAHETASAHVRPGIDDTSQASWRRLPWRRLLADPFDLTRRALLPSIDTLTIRRARSGSHSIVLHQRDAASVAVAGSMLHIMPAGVFQPASVLPTALNNDFNLWRNVQREYSEEFLGNPEHGGDGRPIDYDSTEPFRTLDHALSTGQVRAFCLGIGLDALTLAGEILSVVVIDEEVYDAVFADMVSTNTEGNVAAATVPFEEHTIRRLLSGHPYALAPAAAGCIDLAWQHRDRIVR
jgi:transcriptional regulator with XRE-family HTH domain